MTLLVVSDPLWVVLLCLSEDGDGLARTFQALFFYETD